MRSVSQSNDRLAVFCCPDAKLAQTCPAVARPDSGRGSTFVRNLRGILFHRFHPEDLACPGWFTRPSSPSRCANPGSLSMDWNHQRSCPLRWAQLCSLRGCRRRRSPPWRHQPNGSARSKSLYRHRRQRHIALSRWPNGGAQLGKWAYEPADSSYPPGFVGHVVGGHRSGIVPRIRQWLQACSNAKGMLDRGFGSSASGWERNILERRQQTATHYRNDMPGVCAALSERVYTDQVSVPGSGWVVLGRRRKWPFSSDAFREIREDRWGTRSRSNFRSPTLGPDVGRNGGRRLVCSDSRRFRADQGSRCAAE